MAGRIADGLMPMWYHPERSTTSYADMLSHLQPGFEISAFVPVQITNDIEGALHNVQIAISIFLGDFGIQGMNFHLNAVSRIGYEEEAKRVQDLYLAGSRREAAEAVPLELADSISLVGPIARIRERLEIWRESPVTTILATGLRDEPSLRALKMAVSG
jgi:hypothetical protein